MNPHAARHGRLWLLALLLVALAVRLPGLTTGIPDLTSRCGGYHPDEGLLVWQAGRMVAVGSFDPLVYAYGGLLFYVDAALFWLGPRIGFVSEQPFDYFVVARSVSVACAVLMVWVTFAIGHRSYGLKAGILAASILAIAPGCVEHSQFAMTDIPSSLFFLLAVMASLRLLDDDRIRWSMLAGLAAGLAAGTKYPAGICVIAVLAAVLLGRRRKLHIAVAAIVSVSVFLASNPMAVAKAGEFWSSMWKMNRVNAAGWGMLFLGTGNGFVYQLVTNWPYLVGFPVTVAMLVALVRVGLRHDGRDLVLLAAVLPMAILLVASKTRFMRYWVTPLPVLCLLLASVVVELRAVPRHAVAGLMFGTLALLTGRQVVARLATDPRDAAAVWFATNVESNATVGLPSHLDSWHPPLSRYNSEDVRAAFDAELAAGAAPYRFVMCDGWNLTALESGKPEWFVLSEFDWRDVRRLAPVRRGLPEPWRGIVGRAVRFLDVIERDYALVRRFDNYPIEQRWLSSPAFAPHDWLYPFPQIRVYRRR